MLLEAANKKGLVLKAAEVSEARFINDLLEFFLLMFWFGIGSCCQLLKIAILKLNMGMPTSFIRQTNNSYVLLLIKYGRCWS